ncbi:cytochrome c heme-lyase [Cryptococcus gattii Ru294]|uniref:Holocytochrome c-type synthase n=1 Tax=Cryptococcus gattii serotype B (strain WM276 / ATCC MYA-4071) TaxID=367775 RepID=E6R8J6_CRYGW|nr:Pyruvate carboxylase isoform, putative; Pyc1p [Cryptococcus gattii WM276]ADV23136.1 Pyruvate carboxylase isoform, putative; Pyc1p [Cryptococcus gattii WM276]KIR52673.1 cytochrome c heme-lyase [Cryptococcus gattii Ru294]KIY33882.1 cytochrome c heme-lyase [Cryptococcus gattii E566]KJE04238.1 cytochrome c heme-lyase [Cryptococcus gattii NT-10]
MKWNIGSSSASTQVPVDHTAATSIPSDHPHIPSSSSSRPPAQCPMHQADVPLAPVTANAPAKCPIQHDALDPTTHMPVNLSLSRQPDQKLDLPTERTASTIPRPYTAPGGEAYGTGNTWDYPSPQQFYNALVRKGWETPEDSVEVMVAIHNFLNERAWDEVMKWEKRLPGGDQSQLARFQGRPGELSPKARFHLWAGKLFPSKFNTEPPFDRHDWVVTRPSPSAPQETVTARYVIDYYSAPPDEDGNPVFSLDVRPALDNLEAIKQRISVGVEEWLRGDVD